jgi:hypothetical protein
VKLTLEHEDILAALRSYARDVLYVELPDTPVKIEMDDAGFACVTFRDAKPIARPAAVVSQPQPAPAPATPVTASVTAPAAASGPKSLEQVIDEQRSSINWKEESLGATDLSALGKGDPSNFADEISGPAKPFATRS